MLVIVIFFFNDTATTEIYTLSLHDALPICGRVLLDELLVLAVELQLDDGAPVLELHLPDLPDLDAGGAHRLALAGLEDRKSTRLNSSHANISYAVFCLKKKKKNHK